VVAGKPEPPLLQETLRRVGGTHPLMVGDRLDTDIEGALRLGWDACLVLTGVHTREDAEAAPRPPTFIVHDLRGLFERV
jgi:ribonucleotide monophosphatase NagD (HAD superfamily)